MTLTPVALATADVFASAVSGADESPRRFRGKKKSSPAWLGMTIGGIAALVLIGGGIFFAMSQGGSSESTDPESLALATTRQAVPTSATPVAAGAFQLSPLKHRCLRACRSPLGFLLGHWRAGVGGGLALGWWHAL